MKIIDRHIAASMIPKRGLTTRSSHNPKLYSRLIVQNRLAVVKIHHGSLLIEDIYVRAKVTSNLKESHSIFERKGNDEPE